MPKNDDVDWGGLLLFGSLLGNLVQSGKSASTEAELQEKEAALQKLLSDRNALLQNLRIFHQAVENFRAKTEELESINRDLLREKEEQTKKVMELQERVAALEFEKTKLSADYASKLEGYLKKVGAG